MTSRTPTQEEVLDMFSSLSNWGRWGSDDQHGTLNLITPEKTVQAAQLVREGATVTCARTIGYDAEPDLPNPPLHYMVESGDGWFGGNKLSSIPVAVAVDFIGLVFHGHAITHIDSLGHFFWDGKMYNGQPAHLVSTNLGATSGSIEPAKNSIVSRGVLVDAPMVRGVEWLNYGDGVMPEDIEAAEERCGFRIEPGDVLLVRTGQFGHREIEGPVDLNVAGSSACHAACLPLFRERDIAVLCSDTPNDLIPAPYPQTTHPVHQVGIVAMGLWIVDNANLEDLARACRERNRWEFLISINPLRLHNGTGSPVNPVAVF